LISYERIGRYELRSILGRGSLGVVYRGFDPEQQRHIALKVLEKHDIEVSEQERVLARFRQEASIAGRLEHPRIAALLDFTETPDYACIVMQLVEGRPLSAELEEQGLLDPADAWIILRQVLDGLEYCHSHGVVHRDLKPANILVDGSRGIKITDFGVARIDSSRLTQLGDALGTPHYMAPEQLSGLPSTPATDLYQVGVIAYEMLTGERPFVGQSAEILRRVLRDRPADASTLNAGISPALDAVLQKALAKDPVERYASARDLSEAFRGCLERRAA
jgi:serine/threonine protein kinase